MEHRIITAEQLKDYQPKEVHEAKIRHVHEMYHYLVTQFQQTKQELNGYPTNYWTFFDEAFGGARPGELLTLTGETGSGKTTWAINWLLLMLQTQVPCLLFSLEIRWKAMVRVLATMMQQKPFHEFTETDLSGVSEVFSHVPLFVFDHNGMVDGDLVMKGIDYAVEKHGVKFILIDHLDYITKAWDRSRNEAYIIGDFLRNLCGKAHEREVTILQIAHPSKRNLAGNRRMEIGIDELKGSSSIKQESDAVLSIFQPEDEEPTARIRFLKIRAPWFSRHTNAYIDFEFDPYSQRFREKTGIRWDE